VKKRILITGGAGFIGSHLADELLARGYQVRALDCLAPQVHGPEAARPDFVPEYLSAEVELWRGDVRDPQMMRSALKGVDAVCHLAALVGVGQSMYEVAAYTEVNNLGTAVLLEALLEHPVERLIVASSMSIYGEGLYRAPDGRVADSVERTLEQLRAGDWEVRNAAGEILTPIPTPENKAPALASLYALSKYDQERMALLIGRAYGIPTVALRFFNVYGTRQAISNPYTGVLAIFAARYLNRHAPLIFEDGAQRRDFVSVSDVAQACCLALEVPQAADQVFNVGSGQAYTVRAVAEQLARVLNQAELQPELTGQYRVGDIRHCFADITRARQVLGYEPRVTLEAGLTELAGWLEGRVAVDRVAEASAELAARGLTISGNHARRTRKVIAMSNNSKETASSAEPQPAAARAAAAVAQPATKAASEAGRAAIPASGSSLIGVYEWFQPNEHERVERVLADLKTLGIRHLRTGVSWADWCTPSGGDWYKWLLPRLAQEVEILPYFVYTPPSLGVVPKTSAPPRDPKWYADFIDQMITLFGEHFEWVELWSGPSNSHEWDVALDPEWWVFSQMVGGAAYWARQRGKKTVLGSTGPIDLHWVRLMCERNVMQYIDAVGVLSIPAMFESAWEGWAAHTARVREVLNRHGSEADLWITGAGYSTWRHDERQQLAAFVEAVEAPVERVYWYSVHDLDPGLPAADGAHSDERELHFGMKKADGTPKLLYRLWESGGLAAVREAAWWGEPARHGRKKRPVLITGGAGFIGTNLAHRLLSAGRPVLLYDNLARPGVEQNLQWLRETHGDLVQIEVADVRNRNALAGAVKRAAQVFHLAAQVAVTTSMVEPLLDFEINTRGTLNLLEALRALNDPPPLVYTSTNKVYGALHDIELKPGATRYAPVQAELREHGISEARPLDFYSPYGCSKGAADQYICDYARTFELPAVVLRMSCIYGPHQFGTEDQGWVAHFLIRALTGTGVTIYGDGCQVRDVLFVDDLVNALLLAQKQSATLAGQAFNIGGGPAHTLSLLELLELLGELAGRKPVVSWADWRVGDQRYFVSDTRKFRTATGWKPQMAVRDGVARLAQWLRDTRGIEPVRRLAHKVR
jgi:CDP-paratose 2-epimerase